jgi:transposase
VIHAFNETGLAALDPKWAGGRPRQITDDDIAFIIETATTRPARLGRPFTHWSIRRWPGRSVTQRGRSCSTGAFDGVME